MPADELKRMDMSIELQIQREGSFPEQMPTEPVSTLQPRFNASSGIV
jgi:hypothetical protein